MIQKLNERFHAPTPDKYRKIGKSIALLGTMLQVSIGSLQAAGSVVMPGGYITWVIGIAVLQWLGQTISDFATEEPKEKEDVGQN